MFYTIDKIKDKIRPCGRYAFVEEKLNIDWVGGGFEINFEGDYIRIFFETEAGENPVYILVDIDGKEQKFAVSGSNTAFAADNMGEGKHLLKLVRITEVDTNQQDIKDYLFVTGIDLGACGKIYPSPNKKRLVIDFYGDSITNAWQALAYPGGEERRICDNDYSVSYAYKTAENLDAEARVCAVSGHGIISDCNGVRENPMKKFYQMKSRHLPIKMTFEETPDIIVVSLGTNDGWGGVGEEEFAKGAAQFVKMLRKDSPKANIIWLYGAMGGDYKPTLKRLIEDMKKDDLRLGFLPVEAVSEKNGEVGGLGHPNKKGELRLAKELTEYITKNILNA